MPGNDAMDHPPFPDAAGHDPSPAGVARKPVVVLVPGMDGTGRLFHVQEALLAPAYEVHTVPLRDDATRMDVLVEDLAARLRALGTPDGAGAIVVGESFGGTLALSLALAHPGLVRALVVVNSFPYFRPQHRLHAALLGLRLLPWGAMPLVRRLTAWRLHSRFTHRAEVQRFLRETRATTRRGYLNRLRILTRYDVRAALPRLAVPTLFVAADRDHLVPAVAQARLMAGLVPGASVRVLEGHGHICLIAPGVDLARILAQWGGAGPGGTNEEQPPPDGAASLARG